MHSINRTRRILLAALVSAVVASASVSADSVLIRARGRLNSGLAVAGRAIEPFRASARPAAAIASPHDSEAIRKPVEGGGVDPSSAEERGGAATPCDGLPAGVGCYDRWMTELGAYIAQRPLTKLLIPGAHNAGTSNFRTVVTDPEDYQEPFARNQSLTIYQQLLHGIRRFDLRFQATDTGVFLRHGPVISKSYALRDAVNEILAFEQRAGHDGEIVMLDVQIEGDERYENSLIDACNYFLEKLEDRLIVPEQVRSGRNASEVSDWLSATTVQDIWDWWDTLPLVAGGPIIGHFGGGGSNFCYPMTSRKKIKWTGFSDGGWYANQCKAEYYGGLGFDFNPFVGIIHSAGQALEERKTGKEVPHYDNGMDDGRGGFYPTIPGDPVLDFYSFGTQPTQSAGCILASAEFLRGQNGLVLNAVRDWYTNGEHNARKHLNIVSGDFVEQSGMMDRIFEMIGLGGPGIELVSMRSGDADYTTTPPSWANHDVIVTQRCATPDGTVDLASSINSGVTGGFNSARIESQLQTDNSEEDQKAGGQSLNTACIDSSGRVAVTRVTGIHIDKTPPSISMTELPPAPNPFGWYKEYLTVKMRGTCSDALSGPQQPEVSARHEFTEDVNEYAMYVTCVDWAGNKTSDGQTIRIDTKPPTITGSRTPLANANGWNNTDVTVTFTCDADGGSGIHTCENTPQVISGERAGISRSASATDEAGNSASATVDGINIDKTLPTIKASRTPPNANGWNNTDVTVSFECSDDRSGVDAAGCPLEAKVTTEGSGLTYTGSVTDKAGNQNFATVSGINIDKTLPVFSNVVNRADDATMPAGAVVFYTLPTVSDNFTSGIVPTCTPAAGSTFAVGTTTVTCLAMDNAGNGGHASFTVKVRSPLEQLNRLLPLVRGVGPGASFENLVLAAAQALARGNVNAAVSALRALTNIVEAQSEKSITAEQAEDLIAKAVQIIHVLGF